MVFSLLFAITIFAQGPDEAPPAPDGPPGWFMIMPYIGMAIVFFYLLVYLPARTERKQREKLNNMLKKNDKVITSAGIIGVVTSINDKEDEITLRIEEGKIKVLKNSILRILSESESTSTTGKKA